MTETIRELVHIAVLAMEVLAVLIIVLLIRPQGILGRRERIG